MSVIIVLKHIVSESLPKYVDKLFHGYVFAGDLFAGVEDLFQELFACKSI